MKTPLIMLILNLICLGLSLSWLLKTGVAAIPCPVFGISCLLWSFAMFSGEVMLTMQIRQLEEEKRRLEEQLKRDAQPWMKKP